MPIKSKENIQEKKIFDSLDYFDTYTLAAPEIYKGASIYYNYREKNVTIGTEFIGGVSNMDRLLKVSLYRQFLFLRWDMEWQKSLNLNTRMLPQLQ